MKFWLPIALLLLAPALHPLLIPWVGVPSHLMWWVHVLPVALVAFRFGSVGAASVMAVSLVSVLVGERVFGAGYGVPAPPETSWALTIAIFATHSLVAGFALYARATARRYQMLFDNAVSAILRTDEKGRIIAANPAAIQLFECRWRDLRGRSFEEIPWLVEVPAPETLVGHEWSGTLAVGPEGSEKISHVSAVALDGQDSLGYQVLLIDRSEEVVRDRELQRQGRLAVLGSTLAGVAHEMKNPLQVILGHAELALDPAAPDSEARESLEVVQEQAQRLSGLVQELLGFSRPDAEPDEIRLAETIKRIVGLHRVSHGRSVKFQERVLWNGTLVASAVRVEQILANLISNAVDAAPKGRGRVDIELRREGSDAVILVGDNGGGIDPALGDRIFDPFVSSKKAGEGTGLGLAICRRLASAMGGTLTAHNRSGSGAAFELRIPIRQAESASPSLLDEAVVA
ncbi:MAG: ATP-binding protein [Gemmatimonadota bacterium]